MKKIFVKSRFQPYPLSFNVCFRQAKAKQYLLKSGGLHIGLTLLFLNPYSAHTSHVIGERSKPNPAPIQNTPAHLRAYFQKILYPQIYFATTSMTNKI